jgi:hypothetical protein
MEPGRKELKRLIDMSQIMLAFTPMPPFALKSNVMEFASTSTTVELLNRQMFFVIL